MAFNKQLSSGSQHCPLAKFIYKANFSIRSLRKVFVKRMFEWQINEVTVFDFEKFDKVKEIAFEELNAASTQTYSFPKSTKK